MSQRTASTDWSARVTDPVFVGVFLIGVANLLVGANALRTGDVPSFVPTLLVLEFVIAAVILIFYA